MAKRTTSRRCDQCLTIYTAKTDRSKFCSDSCRVMAYKKRHGIPLPDFANLSAIQKKFVTPENIKVRDISNQLLVLASRRRSAEAEYERHRKAFEEADAELKQRIENMNEKYVYTTQKNIEYQEKKRDSFIAPMQEAANRLSEIDREAVKLQSQLAAAEQRLTVQGIEKRREVISSADLRARNFDVLPVEGEFLPFLGRPERGFVQLVYGEPFSGKSSLCLRLLDYLTRFGSCAYVSAEEGISESFKRKVQQWTSPSSNITITAERIPQGIKRTAAKFDFVVIDSVQAAMLSVDDLDSIAANKKTSLIAVLQSTKSGEYRGTTGYTHLADIIWAISIADNRQKIEIEKNRFL